MWLLFNGAAALGPALVFGGWNWGCPVALWIGAALCLFDEFMNVASGLHRLPVLAALLSIIGAGVVQPWHDGAVLGLACWIWFSFLGQLFSRRRLSPQS